MHKLTIVFLFATIVTGCASLNKVNIVTKRPFSNYDYMAVKDFNTDRTFSDARHSGQEVAALLSDEILSTIKDRHLFKEVYSPPVSDLKKQLILEGRIKSIRFARGVSPEVKVAGRFVDGDTGEVLVEFEHEEGDLMILHDAIQKVAQKISAYTARLYKGAQ